MQYHIHAKFHNYGLSGSGFVMGGGLLLVPPPPQLFHVKKSPGWLGLRRSAKAFEINFTSTLSKVMGHQF